MFLKLKIYIHNLIFIKFKVWSLLHFDQLIKSQIKNSKSIPILIINFNQLFYLKQLINFLLERKFENIIIIDNKSTYKPLLDYYEKLEKVKIEYMAENYGHMVFFEKIELQKKYGQGFFVVTDADIVPNKNLPDDFMKVMIDILLKEFNKVNKVGFALDIKNIPDYYSLKGKVIKWEGQFWKDPYDNKIDSYKAFIDTTFALYKPRFPKNFNDNYFLEGVRIASDFTAQHGGWFIDNQNLTEEQKYYFEKATISNSWKIDKEGLLSGRMKNVY